MSEVSTSLDLDLVRREIDEEVRARRASGDFPPGMERELDLAFARVSPVATTGDDLEGLIQAADRSAFIEARPPVASRTAVLGLVKKGELKLLGWYFNHLAQQMTSFAGQRCARSRWSPIGSRRSSGCCRRSTGRCSTTTPSPGWTRT